MTNKPRILALFGSAILYGADRGNIEALAALRQEGAEVLCLVRDEKWNTVIPKILEARGIGCCKVPYTDHLHLNWAWYVLRNSLSFVIANWGFLRTVRKFKPTHIHAYN